MSWLAPPRDEAEREAMIDAVGKDGAVAQQRATRSQATDKAATRDRILDAAWTLFVARGFDGTTVTEIEAAVGLAAGSGSFYRHFASKEDVLRAAVDREVGRVDAERQLPPSALTGDARLELALEFQRRLSNLRKIQPLMTVLAREQRHLGESTDRLRAALIEKNLSLRAEILAGWISQGALPDRDPRSLAGVIVSALVGYHFAREYFGDRPGVLPEASFVGTLADLVLGLPSATPPS
jgi:AcrR family transcriptional regulator